MEEFLGLISDHALNLGLSLLFLVLIFTLRYLILRTVVARLHDAEAAFRARKLSFYISVGLLLFALAWIWTSQLANAGSFIGLLSAGVAIALSDVLKNVAGWGLILFRRPFKVGDRIEVGPNAGDVIDIGVFRFSLMEIRNWVDADQTTGRILHIPNGILFVEPLANYTEGFPYIWLEIPMTVTFESDWEVAREMVQGVIDRHAADPEEVGTLSGQGRTADRYFNLYQDLAPAVLREGHRFRGDGDRAPARTGPWSAARHLEDMAGPPSGVGRGTGGRPRLPDHPLLPGRSRRVRTRRLIRPGAGAARRRVAIRARHGRLWV